MIEDVIQWSIKRKPELCGRHVHKADDDDSKSVYDGITSEQQKADTSRDPKFLKFERSGVVEVCLVIHAAQRLFSPSNSAKLTGRSLSRRASCHLIPTADPSAAGFPSHVAGTAGLHLRLLTLSATRSDTSRYKVSTAPAQQSNCAVLQPPYCT